MSFSCKRRVKDCFRHPARSMDNCWVVSTKVQNALPLSQCCQGSRGDQLRREMAGFVIVYVERFQVHVARGLAGKPRMGMGRHHGVCGPLKFYYCFSPLMAETRASLPSEIAVAKTTAEHQQQRTNIGGLGWVFCHLSARPAINASLDELTTPILHPPQRSTSVARGHSFGQRERRLVDRWLSG